MLDTEDFVATVVAQVVELVQPLDKHLAVDTGDKTEPTVVAGLRIAGLSCMDVVVQHMDSCI